MASRKRIFDSPREWVREHTRAYVRTKGKDGHVWNGVPTLLLTTRGRKTGRLRRTPVIYGRDGKHYVIVASYGGRPQHPQWYLNLIEHPEVEVQAGADKFSARARTATKAERPRLWRQMARLFPQYKEYKKKAAEAGREIPVVILEPV